MARPALPPSKMAPASASGDLVVVTIRTTDDVLAILDAIGAKADRTRAAVMRLAVDAWLAGGAKAVPFPRGDRRALARLSRDAVSRIDASGAPTREGAVLSAIHALIAGNAPFPRRLKKSTKKK